MLVNCLLALITAVGAVSGSASTKETRNFHPKPSEWMLKPTTDNNSDQKPTPKALSFRNSLGDSDTYFIIHIYYSATGGVCDYGVLSRVAYATNHCFVTSSTSSGMYYCAGDTTCYYYEYSDTVCGNSLGYTGLDIGTCKYTDADDDGYVTDGGAGIVFLSQQLTAQLGLPPPLLGTSTTYSYYTATDCSTDYGTFETHQTYPNTCYSNYNGQAYTSTIYVEPNQINYGAYGCESSSYTDMVYIPLNQCFVSVDNDYSSNMVTTYVEIPSTPFPTEFPTDYPTVKPTIKDEPSAPPTDYPTYFPTTPKVDYDAIVGTTLAEFSAMAVINTLLFFFQPPQDTSSVSQTSNPAETVRVSEF
eukprot:gene12086-14005_t